MQIKFYKINKFNATLYVTQLGGGGGVDDVIVCVSGINPFHLIQPGTWFQKRVFSESENTGPARTVGHKKHWRCVDGASVSLPKTQSLCAAGVSLLLLLASQTHTINR